MSKITATIAIIAAVILSGCVRLAPYSEAPVEVPQAKRVVVVGDSITAYATPELNEALYDFRHSVTGWPGIDLADGRADLVKPGLAMRPDMMVVELGINSARESWDASDLTHLDGILSDVSGVPCVVWPVLTAETPSYFDHLGTGTLADRIGSFRVSLAKRLPAHPNVHMADWSAVEREHPEYLRADGLHMNAAGRLAYAAFVDASLKKFCDYA